MSGFNSFQPSVGTSASFWDPSLQMSDGSESGRRFSCASAGFKLSQALAQSAWENKKKKRKKKRMVTGEIVVIAFKATSTGEKRTRRRCVGRWPAVLHNVVAGKHKLLERLG